MTAIAPYEPLQRTGASSNSAPVRPLEYSLKDQRKYSEKNPKKPDWTRMLKSFRESLRSDSLALFASGLNTSTESWIRLGLGFDRYQYTLPMKSADGTVIGIRTRPIKGGKLTMEGGKPGLFIPEQVTAANLEVICEGESDTAAALTLGLNAIGTPGARQAMAEAAKFASGSQIRIPCIIADNGSAGEIRAEALAKAILAEGVPCKVLLPPEDHGDLRDWIAAEGLMGKHLRQAIDQQEILYPEQWTPGFAMLPNAFLRNGAAGKLGHGPTLLALVLKSFEGRTKTVFPAREALADLLNVSVCTVDRYKAALVEAGVIQWRRGRRGRCNEYRIDLGPIKTTSRTGQMRGKEARNYPNTEGTVCTTSAVSNEARTGRPNGSKTWA